MISIVKVEYLAGYEIKLCFSDNTEGVINFEYLTSMGTVLTNALKDKKYFAECFIEFGALCWKNGLEFSAESLYRKLKDKNALQNSDEVA